MTKGKYLLGLVLVIVIAVGFVITKDLFGKQLTPVEVPVSQNSIAVHHAVDPSGTSTVLQVQPSVAPVHDLGTVTMSPPWIAEGSAEPFVVTVEITDPSVIRTSINLLQVMAGGQTRVWGQLNDDGTGGDLVAHDGIFSITENISSLPSGSAVFRISAAYEGSLRRTVSSDLTLTVAPAKSTAHWQTFTDSQKLFSISVPAEWNLSLSEVRNLSPDTTKDVGFSFPNNATAFIITVHTPSAWTDIQNVGFTSPELLGQTNSYVFGWNEPEDQIITPGFTDEQIRSDFGEIRATFKAH
jgi:hypothetical protein